MLSVSLTPKASLISDCASANYSTGRIRYAVHCDICKRRPGPPSEDAWEDWSAAMREIDEALPEAQPRAARL